jgi:hypothetical protein
MGLNSCPRCRSENISPAESEFSTEYPLWTALAAVLLLTGVLLVLFIFLQLHPVIMILLLIAVVSWLLDKRSHPKKNIKKVEYVCLDCDHRFVRTKE